jgi:hypothetical protein
MKETRSAILRAIEACAGKGAASDDDAMLVGPPGRPGRAARHPTIPDAIVEMTDAMRDLAKKPKPEPPLIERPVQGYYDDGGTYRLCQLAETLYRSPGLDPAIRQKHDERLWEQIQAQGIRLPISAEPGAVQELTGETSRPPDLPKCRACNDKRSVTRYTLRADGSCGNVDIPCPACWGTAGVEAPTEPADTDETLARR